MTPWKEIKNQLEANTDPKLRVEFRATPASLEEPESPMIRYWITLDGETIWDFPKDFPCVAESQTRTLQCSRQVLELLIEYLKTEPEQLLNKRFAKNILSNLGFRNYANLPEPLPSVPLHLVELLLACDRRLNKEHLAESSAILPDSAASRVVERRFAPAEEFIAGSSSHVEETIGNMKSDYSEGDAEKGRVFANG